MCVQRQREVQQGTRTRRWARDDTLSSPGKGKDPESSQVKSPFSTPFVPPAPENATSPKVPIAVTSDSPSASPHSNYASAVPTTPFLGGPSSSMGGGSGGGRDATSHDATSPAGISAESPEAQRAAAREMAWRASVGRSVDWNWLGMVGDSGSPAKETEGSLAEIISQLKDLQRVEPRDTSTE